MPVVGYSAIQGSWGATMTTTYTTDPLYTYPSGTACSNYVVSTSGTYTYSYEIGSGQIGWTPSEPTRQHSWIAEHAGWQHNAGLLTAEQLASQWAQYQRNRQVLEFTNEQQGEVWPEIRNPIPTRIEVPFQQSAHDVAKSQKRARDLLRDFLNPEQLEQFDRENSFIVQVVGGGRYRIKPGQRVDELAFDGRVISRLCIHPHWDLRCPNEDWALTQLLLIESDEQAFRSQANRTLAA